MQRSRWNTWYKESIEGAKILRKKGKNKRMIMRFRLRNEICWGGEDIGRKKKTENVCV